MSTWAALAEQQPGWAWLGVAAVLLCMELATGSGYLLWPSASAAVVAGLAFLHLPEGWPLQALAFAALTIASTYAARRWWPPMTPVTAGRGLSDSRTRLVGAEGRATVDGGRVFVDGKEWAAETEGGAALAPDARVQVVDVVDGGRLMVRPI